jgi:hypothetical protein
MKRTRPQKISRTHGHIIRRTSKPEDGIFRLTDETGWVVTWHDTDRTVFQRIFPDTDYENQVAGFEVAMSFFVQESGEVSDNFYAACAWMCDRRYGVGSLLRAHEVHAERLYLAVNVAK